MKVSDLEVIDMSSPLEIHEAVAAAAKWWADFLRQIPNASKQRGYLPRNSTSVRMTNIPLTNVMIDGQILTPELITNYQIALARRIQMLINAGDETTISMRELLRVKHKPGIVHEYAMKAAGFHPSMTMLPWGAQMWIDSKSMIVTGSPGHHRPVYRIYPDAERYEPSRQSLGRIERRIRKHRNTPID